MTYTSPVFIGIDGGGTRSAGVAVDHNGHVLARARAGSLNFFGSGTAAARRNLKHLVQRLEKAGKAGCSPERAVVGCAALFTDATPAKKQLLCGGILPLARTRVVSDCQTALFGATLGRPGVLVIAGTGSIVLARNQRRRQVSVGGWGHLLGDEGSAWWIAIEAIKAAIAAEENRGPKTLLSAAVRRWFRVRRLSGLVPRIYRADFAKDRLAALAGHLTKTPAARDAVFRSICRKAGIALAEQALAAARLAGLKSRPLPVYLRGSVLTGNADVRRSLVKELKARLKVRIESPGLDAVAGAAALALSAAGVPMTQGTIANLAGSPRLARWYHQR